MSIDWDKPVQTRDGREVRIYTTEGQHKAQPVVGEIGDGINCPPILSRWYASGRDDLAGPTDSDLVNVPQQHTVWVHFYQGSDICCRVFGRPEGANNWGREHKTLACIEVTFTEGEGLDNG